MDFLMMHTKTEHLDFGDVQPRYHQFIIDVYKHNLHINDIQMTFALASL